MMPRMKLKWAFGFAGVSSARSQPAVARWTRVRRQRERRRVRARREDRLHPLELSRAGGHPHGGHGGTLQAGERAVGLRRVLCRRHRVGLCDRRRHGQGDLDAQARLASLRQGHRLGDRPRRSRLCAAGRRRRGRAGRFGDVRVLHVPRQRHGAQRQHGRGDLEDLHRRRAEVRAARTRKAWRRGDRRAEESGRRRRSIRSARPSTSPRATATPTRHSSRPTRCWRSTSTPASCGGRSSRWPTTCGPAGAARTTPDNPNCPAALGPDYDFSASPMLVKAANGKELLLIQQKSGMVYALRSRQEG